MSDLLATSAETWRDRSLDPPTIPAELVPPPADAPIGERLRALHRRHLLREQRAKDVYAASRSPERGWPVADNDAVFAFFRRLVRRRRGAFAAMVVLNGLAAAAALLVPRLLGDLIDRTVSGDTSASSVTSLALVILVVVVAQSLFTFLGQRTSTLFGQDLLASAREYIIDTILRLPLGRVEGASTGDLVTRVTRDVGTMSRSVQYGVPMADHLAADRESLDRRDAAELRAARCAGAAAHRLSMFQVRRYLVRAQKCYIAEGATYSRINTTLTETVEGARTVEALGLTATCVDAGDDDIALSAQAERYGMTLRNLLFSVIDLAFNAPRVVTLLVGGYGYAQGWVTLGEITAAVLYVEALSGPLDRLVGEVDRLQVGAASTSRLLGIAQVPPDRIAGDGPAGRPGPGRPGPQVRLPRGPRRPARRRPDAAHRRAAGHRRPVGLRQVDAGPAALRHQRAAHGFGDASAASSSRRCRWRACAPRSPWSPRSTTSSSGRSATTSCWRARTPPTTRSGTPWPPSAPPPGYAACRPASTR